MTGKDGVERLIGRLRAHHAFATPATHALIRDAAETLESLAQATGQTDDAVVERVARALYLEPESCTLFDELSPASRALLERKARAAIAAMPTEQTNRLEEAALRNAVHIYRGSFNRNRTRPYDEDAATVKAIVAAALAQTTDDRHGPQPPVEED